MQQILVLTLTKQNKMKKLLTVLFVASAMSFVASCGPSAEEKAKMEADAKAKMDSLFNAASSNMATATDSTAVTPDSTATTHAETK